MYYPMRRFNKGTRPGMTGEDPQGPNTGSEEQWKFPRIYLTDSEKKLIIATVAEIGVSVMFRTHVYQFGGRYYHQLTGGPIGLRSTCAVARVVMGDWDLELLKQLEDIKVVVDEKARYMDDIRLFMQAVKLGWRWSESGLAYQEDWRVEEENREMTGEEKTAEIILPLMNKIHHNLSFTVELAKDFADGKLPTLDTKLWMENGVIMYDFYEKPMVGNRVMSKKSAIGENTKISSLSNDLIRRLKNCSELLADNQRIKVVDSYAQKLVNSGYSWDQTVRIITSGIKGYESKRKRCLARGEPLHKSAASGAAARIKKKLTQKSAWFKDKKREEIQSPARTPVTGRTRVHQKVGQDQGKDKVNKKKTTIRTTTVLFVEQTPGGELARRLRQLEQRLSEVTGWRVKIVERGGTTIKQVLPNTNPWAGAVCGKSDCVPCRSNNPVRDCSKRGILYQNKCLTCSEEGNTNKVYIGESSRSLYERAAEHHRDFKGKKEDSHMHKHCELEHEGREDIIFQFSILGTYRDALSRQIAEAVSVRRTGAAAINSKGIYNRCSLPRLVVEDNGWQLPDVREEKEEVPTEWRRENRRRKRQGEKAQEVDCPGQKLKRRRLGEDTAQEDWGCQPPTEEDRRKDDFLQSRGPALVKKDRKWRQPRIKTRSPTEYLMRRIVVEDVLERVSWLAVLGEQEEELRMSISDWDSLQGSTTMVGQICVQNVLEKVVNRAFRIVEYRKEKRRKQEETGQIVEEILRGIVSRGENIVGYRRKVEQKKKKSSAEYPSVINWLTPKHPVGNQTAGASIKDGAKCGNGLRNNKTESNQTAGMESEIGLECGISTESRRNFLPGLEINSDERFNHNSNPTKTRIKGGKRKTKPINFYSNMGGKRKASNLDIQCQADNLKRRRCGPMDRFLVDNDPTKLGDPEVKGESSNYAQQVDT